MARKPRPWNDTNWALNNMTCLHVGEWPQVKASARVLAHDPMRDKPSRHATQAPALDAEIPVEQPLLSDPLLHLDDTPRRAASEAGRLRLAALTGATRRAYRR